MHCSGDKQAVPLMIGTMLPALVYDYGCASNEAAIVFILINFDSICTGLKRAQGCCYRVLADAEAGHRSLIEFVYGNEIAVYSHLQ